MATATKKMPTAAQMKAYADQLPAIYRDLLKAMAQTDPERVVGDVFVAHLVHSKLEGKYSRRAIEGCLMELESQNYLSLEDRVGAIELTDLGEELLAAVTGKKPKAEVVPKLPKPTW